MRGGVSTKSKMMAIAVVLLMAFSAVPMMSSDDSDASYSIGSDYEYKVTYGVNAQGATVMTKVLKNGLNIDLTASDYRSNWQFDSTSGLGPYNSFYATFTVNGEFYELLDPANLEVKIAEWSIKGWVYDQSKWTENTTVSHIETCNTMWVLPTVYLSTAIEGSETVLTFSNRYSDGAQAYAHTRDGKIGEFLAIGVYEAHVDTAKNVLNSMSGETPSYSVSRPNFRNAAVNTYTSDGQDSMLWNYYQWSLYCFCSYTVSGTFDLKSLYSYGPRGPAISGYTNTSGPYGMSGDGNSVRCFLENTWGGYMWEFVDDIIVDHAQVYLGMNSVPTDTTVGKTKVGTFSTSSVRIKTLDVSTLERLGFPASYTGYYSADSMPFYILANSGIVAGIVVGGGYSSDPAYYQLGTFSYQDTITTASGQLGSRLSYIFDIDTTGGRTGNIDWEVDSDGVLHITSFEPGTAVQVPAFEKYAPWARFNMSITKIDLSADINKIGENAFNGMMRVTSVEQNGSTNLSVKSYGSHCFIMKGGTYPHLYIPADTSEIGDGAFVGMILHYSGSKYQYNDPLLFDSSNRLIYINPSYTGDINPTTVPFAANVVEVGSYAGNNINASSVNFPNMNVMGAFAFADSKITSLNSSTAGVANISALTVINDGILQNCLGIDTILLSDSNKVDVKGPSPFQGMKNLQTMGTFTGYESGVINLMQLTISSAAKIVFDQKLDNIVLGKDHLEKCDFRTEIYELHIKGDVQVNYTTIQYLQRVKNLYFEDGVVVMDGGISMGASCILETAYFENITDGDFKLFFRYSPKLTKVTYSGMTNLVNNAFESCKALVSLNSTENVIDVGSVNISYQCFIYCSSITDVTGTCTKMSSYAFYQCYELKNVYLPNVGWVYECTFMYDSKLNNANLHSAESVDKYAFYQCNDLKTIDFTSAKTIGYGAFFQCNKYLTSVSMPNVTTIAEYGFQACSELVTVEFPSLKDAGYQAFNGCTRLTTCVMPNLETIGGYCFAYLKYLVTIKKNADDPIGVINISGVTNINTYAFRETNINNVLINKDVLLTGECQFSYCYKLKTMKVTNDPGDLETDIVDISGLTSKYFGAITFHGSNLMTHFRLGDVRPEGLMNYGFFEGCSALKIVEINETWQGQFTGCTFNGVTLNFFGCNYDGTIGICDLRGLEFMAADRALSNTGNFTKVIVSEASLQPKVQLGLNRFAKMTTLEIMNLTDVNDTDMNKMFTSPNIFNASVSSVKLILNNIASGDINGLGYLKSRITSLTVTGVTDEGDSFSIKDDVFSGCSKLTEVRGIFDSFGSSAFYQCYALKVVGLPTDDEGVLNLTGIKQIRNKCFESCTTLTTIKGAQPTSIDQRAFYGCTGLNVTIGTGLVLTDCLSYGSEAFYGVTGLKGNLAFNPDVKASGLGKAAFYETSITTVSVSGGDVKLKNLSTIPQDAFRLCTSLKSVNLKGIDKVDSNAFNGCTKLKLIVLPNAFMFSTGCFKGCSGVSYLTTDAYDGEENGLFISADDVQELFSEFGSVSFPNLVEVKGFPEVDTLSNNMFLDARKLERVSGFEKLDNIPDGTFSGCVSLTNVDIPNILSIGNDAFKGCISLSEISDGASSSVTMTYVTTLGDSVFDGCTSLYKAVLSDTILSFGTYLFNGCASLDVIQFPSNLHTIPSYTFNGCQNLLSSASGVLNLPSGVKVIDEHAFDGCNTIRKIVFPEGLERINGYAFNACPLAFRDTANTFTVPSTVTYIGAHAFDGCTTLYTLDMESSMVVEIGEYAFNECGLKKVTFSPVLQRIGAYAFYKCTALESANLPSALKYIGEYAFSYCRLTTVAIPERVEDISNAFRSNKNLTSVTLPKATTRGANAFVMDDGSRHTNTVKVYVNSTTWSGAAPFSKTDNLDIYSVFNSWNVRQTWFNDYTTGETKSDYSTVYMLTPDEIWYGGYTNPIEAIVGSSIVLPSIKAVKTTADEQRYLYAYGEGGLKVGYSDDTITLYGSMELSPVESAGPMTLHYTSSNPMVTLKSPTDRDYSYGDTFVLEEAVPNEEGVLFSYWQCVLDDKITIVNCYAGDPFTVWRPISEMRAIWSDMKFDLWLYYFKVDGTLTLFPYEDIPPVYTNPIQFSFGEEIQYLPDIRDPSEYGYDNYQFNGWWTEKNGGGIQYENGMLMPTRNLTLYAYFTPNPHYIDVYLSPSDPTRTASVVVYGDTTITSIENNNNTLMYTDAKTPIAATLINASEFSIMDGKYISEWRLNSAAGNTIEPGTKITSSVHSLYAISDDIQYWLYYKFYDVGTSGNPEMTGKEVKLGDATIKSGDHTVLEYSDFVLEGDDLRYTLDQPTTVGKGFVEWKNMKSKVVTYVSEGNFSHDGSKGAYVFTYTVSGSFDGSSFTVSYDKNYKGADNSNLVDSRSYKIDNYIVLPTSTVLKRSGYNFEGWTWDAAGTDPITPYLDETGKQIKITQALVDSGHLDSNMVFKFYAQWSAKSYIVKYDANGGEIDGRVDGSERAYPDVPFNIASFTLKKSDGYRFIGWCIDPEGQGSKVYADGFQNAVVSSAEISEFVGESSKDITFYAIWKKVSYTIKFDLKGGTSTVPLTIEDVKVDEEFKLLAEGTYSAKFKTLKCWHILDNTDEGSSFSSTVPTVKLTRGMASAATIVDGVNIITVNAVWSDNRYTVKYDLTLDGKISGGAKTFPIDDHPDGYAIGDPFEFPDEKEGQYTLEGYVFKGWSPIAIGDTRAYEDGIFTATFASSTSSYVVTFYAVWEKETYNLIFDLGGGILTNTPNTYIDTLTYISAPVKEGAEFLGWTVAPASEEKGTDGLGPNALVDLLGDGEYMAWTGKQTLATNFMNLQNAGKTVELVANWKFKEYTMAYSINGGSCDDIVYETLRGSIGSDIDLPRVDNPYKQGYVLDGWSLKDGTFLGKASTTDTKVTIKFTQNMAAASEDGETVWVYALWKAIKYNVRYYADEDSSNYSTVSISFDEPLALDEPVRSGWEFTGWKGNLSGDTPQYSRNGIIWYAWDYKNETALGPYFMNLAYEAGATVEVYGTWERTLYSVGYNFNGGTSGKIDGDTTGRVGEAFKFNSDGGSVKYGYTFTGWSVDGVTVISKEGMFTENMAAYADVNDMVTLYAVWSPITYEIEYRYDSTTDYTKITAMYDVQFALEAGDKSGYKFVGWASTDVDKTIAKYSITGEYWIQWAESAETVKGPFFLNLSSVADSTVHLDAVWEVIEYKVIYNANGGTGQVPTDDNTYAVGSEFKFQSYDSLIGTNGNKNVVGWSTNPEAKVAMALESFTESLAKTADLTYTVTFYAVWVDGLYTVMVDVGDAKVSNTPVGWTKLNNTQYIRSVEYGTAITDVMEAWNSVTVSKEGHLFTGWSYDYSKVIDNMTIKPIFEKVMQELLYYCIGIIALLVIVAIVLSRLERS